MCLQAAPSRVPLIILLLIHVSSFQMTWPDALMILYSITTIRMHHDEMTLLIR